ncbi:hypothetical protein U1Q18_032366, partial [Sarracenia purpurea var. burkii]
TTSKAKEETGGDKRHIGHQNGKSVSVDAAEETVCDRGHTFHQYGKSVSLPHVKLAVCVKSKPKIKVKLLKEKMATMIKHRRVKAKTTEE